MAGHMWKEGRVGALKEVYRAHSELEEKTELRISSKTTSAIESVLKENRHPVQPMDASGTAAGFKNVYKPQGSLGTRAKCQNIQDHLARTQKIFTHDHNGTPTCQCDGEG